MTFIMVKKRGNTRLFFDKNNDGRFENPEIGTAVDNTITKYDE